MEDMVVNNIENNETQINNDNVSEEEIVAAEEKILATAQEKLTGYGLKWTFRSIEYALNKENVTFGQLRSCVYMTKEGPAFDYVRSVKLLIKAGLVGSKQISDSDAQKLEDRAYEIMEDWREYFGYLGTLHLLMIDRMEKLHFFITDPDLAVMNRLDSKNSQKDLVRNLLMEDLEEKMKQKRALKIGN